LQLGAFVNENLRTRMVGGASIFAFDFHFSVGRFACILHGFKYLSHSALTHIMARVVHETHYKKIVLWGEALADGKNGHIIRHLHATAAERWHGTYQPFICHAN
jgi:hypothetical protein